MGKPIIRINADNSLGHSYPPVPAIQASTDVFAESLGIVRQGDKYAVHCNNGSCHAGAAVGGSTTVFVNNKAVQRQGDPMTCGDTSGGGAKTVYAG